MFKSRGYKILTIDFRNPELSNKFNILESIIKEYEQYIDYKIKSNESDSISRSINMNKNDERTSTSLMARDLMTSEEIKQLHYKMIIFPIIGYPIIRKTILFNKFSCYESGVVKRERHPMQDLSYTYFTVEQIKAKNNEELDPNELINEKIA